MKKISIGDGNKGIDYLFFEVVVLGNGNICYFFPRKEKVLAVKIVFGVCLIAFTEGTPSARFAQWSFESPR